MTTPTYQIIITLAEFCANWKKKAVNTGIASWKNNSFHAALDGRNFFMTLPVAYLMRTELGIGEWEGPKVKFLSP